MSAANYNVIDKMREEGWLYNPRLVHMHHPNLKTDVSVPMDECKMYEDKGYYAEPTMIYHPKDGTKRVSLADAQKAFKNGWYANPAQFPAANTTAEQTFTANGLLSTDTVMAINKPTTQAGLGIVGFRVSAANTFAITFINATGSPITPTASQTYAAPSSPHTIKVSASTNGNVGASQDYYIGIITTVDGATVTGYVAVNSGGTGVTITNGTTIPANSTGYFLVTPTSSTAVTFQFIDSIYTNATGADPSTAATFFGSGTGTFLEEGNIYRYASATGTSPGSINNDNVLATFSIPANSLDGIGNRGLMITAAGSVANNTNSKRLKIFWACTSATVGSAVSGGTLIADTGAYTTTGAAGFEISANVFKYGAANSNTQIALHSQAQIGSTVGGLIVPTPLTATENAVIIIAITGNAVTATTDIVLNWAEINAMN
ncbi:unnamed protein product [Sphagnum jensenii]